MLLRAASFVDSFWAWIDSLQPRLNNWLLSVEAKCKAQESPPQF